MNEKIKKIMVDNRLYNAETGTYIEIKSEKNKNFAVVVKLGHCGQGYYIPALMYVCAKDLNSAIEYAKTLPRVKGNKSNIIDSCEISYVEKLLIENINKQDIFMQLSQHTYEGSSEVLKRRIPLTVYNSNRENWLNSKKNTKTPKPSNLPIKTFPEDCVVERFCVPYRSGHRAIVPSKLNMKELLDEFFYQKVKLYGIEKGVIKLIALYYQLYGKENRLGITYNQGELHFDDKDGNHITELVSPELDIRIKHAEEGRMAPIKEEEIIDEKIQPTIPSSIDRFNARLAKTEEIIKKKNEDRSK